MTSQITWLWLAEQPVLSSSISLPTTDESLGLKIMTCQLFLLLRFILRHLMTEAKTASPLESAVQSISWFYQLGGEPSPAEHPLGKSVLAGAQRLLAQHHTSKKEPITVSQLLTVSCLQGGLDGLFV